MNRKYRICMLTPGSMLFDARIQKEAVGLREEGFDITIYSIEDYKMLDELDDAEGEWVKYNAFMHGIETRRHILLSRKWRKLPKLINRTLQSLEMSWVFLRAALTCRADFYHSHDLIPAFFVWIAHWLYGGRIVYDAHEIETAMAGATGSAEWLLGRYEWVMMRLCSVAITVNPYISRLMEKRYGKAVYVVENRADYIECLPTDLLRDTFSVDPAVRIVMYVGFLSMSRGIDKMTIALKYLPDNVHFYLMGTGRVEEFKDSLNAVREQHGIKPERLRFIGPYRPDEVLNYLCGADASVMLYQQIESANLQFNTPNKLFQSITASVPIVASGNPSFVSFLKTGNDRLGVTVDESAPESIARGVREVLNPAINSMIRKNLNAIRKDYSWESEKQKLLSIYREMTATKGKSS